MKGLLLKDLYMMKSYCKSYLLIAIVFFAISLVGNGNMFFVFYPCLLCGMIPVTLLGYDERSRFLQYSAALPYTKAQIVSEKYLLGLFSQAAVLIVTGIAQGIRMNIRGNFTLDGFVMLMLSVLIISVVASSITLPFIFKFGVERGRVAYYVMIGFVCAAGVLLSQMFKNNWQSNIPSGLVFGGLTILGIGVYVLSWYLSVVFYKKREL